MDTSQDHREELQSSTVRIGAGGNARQERRKARDTEKTEQGKHAQLRTHSPKYI